jgi:hypothetical protein
MDASIDELPPAKTNPPPPDPVPPLGTPPYGVPPKPLCPIPPMGVPNGNGAFGSPELAEQAAMIPKAKKPSPPQANLSWSRNLRVLDTTVYLWPPRELSHPVRAASNALDEGLAKG